MNKYKLIIFLLLLYSCNDIHGMRRPQKRASTIAAFILTPIAFGTIMVSPFFISKIIESLSQWYKQESDEQAIERIRKLTIELLPHSDLYAFIKNIKTINDETVKSISDYLITKKNIQNIDTYLANLTEIINKLENNLQDLTVRLKKIAISLEHKTNYGITAKLAQQLKNLIGRLKATRIFFENPQNKAAISLSIANTTARKLFQQEIEIVQKTLAPKKISYLIVNSILLKRATLQFPLIDSIDGIHLFTPFIKENINQLNNDKEQFNQLLTTSQELVILLTKIKESIVTDIRYQQEKHAQEMLKKLDAIKNFTEEIKNEPKPLPFIIYSK